MAGRLPDTLACKLHAYRALAGGDFIQKRPQVLLPAAHHCLDCASITASRPLHEEVQVEAKAQEVTNASQNHT